MAFELLPVILILSMIAVVPFLLFAIYKIRGEGKYWKYFFMGWLGWILALVIRIVPVQLPQQIFYNQLVDNVPLLLLYLAFASAMAGIVEEGIRYVILQQKPELRKNSKMILSFGLGWGIGEAIIIYLPAIISLLFLVGTVPSVFELLAGAVERNIAILAHLGFTYVVLATFTKKRKNLVFLAMFLHFIFNIAATYTLVLTQNVWYSELAAVIMMLVILKIADRIHKK